VPLYYSSMGFGPLNRSFRASSASTIFEYGLRSLESFSLDFRCHCNIWVRALVPRIIFFVLAAPPYYSSAGFSPSNRFLWASGASILFECGLRSLESFSLGQQCLHIIRVRASIPRIIFFGPTSPPYYSSMGFESSNHFLQVISVSVWFECEFSSLESLLAINAFISTRNTVAIGRFGCRMSNTMISPQLATLDGPIFTSSALCRENFCAYDMKYCTDGCIRCLVITGLRPNKSIRGMGRSNDSPRSFESGDSNLSKLTIVLRLCN
jgi:hypothetical protein